MGIGIGNSSRNQTETKRETAPSLDQSTLPSFDRAELARVVANKGPSTHLGKEDIGSLIGDTLSGNAGKGPAVKPEEFLSRLRRCPPDPAISSLTVTVAGGISPSAVEKLKSFLDDNPSISTKLRELSNEKPLFIGISNQEQVSQFGAAAFNAEIGDGKTALGYAVIFGDKDGLTDLVLENELREVVQFRELKDGKATASLEAASACTSYVYSMVKEGNLPSLGSEVSRRMQEVYDKVLDGYSDFHGGDQPLSSRDAQRQAEIMNERLAEVGGARFVDGTIAFKATEDGRIAISFVPSKDWVDRVD